jgi:acyl CoA:acetate/3-ketoacid CoA transferase
MTRQKVISASDAARLIPDGAIVTVSSSSGLGCPDAVLKAVGERFDSEGHPRNITTLHPIAAGDMWGVKGVDHIAKPGCLARVIAGSYPSGPSSAEPPEIWKMITGDAIPAYNVPSGILFDIHREAGRPDQDWHGHLRRPGPRGLRDERKGRGGADRQAREFRWRRLAVLSNDHAGDRDHSRDDGR